MKLQVAVERPDLVPERKTVGSAGLDLRILDDAILFKDVLYSISTGVRVAIPKGYVGLVIIRSSWATRHLELANSVGVIDADYRGEILLPLKYAGDNEPLRIPAGTRVAQLLIVPYLPVEIEVVDELDQTERGEGGFGSTGER